MNKKKILFLVNHDIVIYNFRKEIIEELLKEGYEVIVSSPYGDRIQKLLDMGCKYDEVKIDRHGKNPLTDLKLINYYRKLMKKIKPDVVLTFTIKPNIYGGLVSNWLSIPYIANITGLGTAVEKKGLVQNITVLLYKHSFKKIKKVFFQNEENMMFFKNRNIALDTYELLPGSGVNLKEFKVLEYPSESVIKFVFISRIMKEKGIDQYLETAKYIKKKYPNTEFHICGFCEESYEEKLNYLNSEGIIIYHGMVNNIKRILLDMHCTVHPSFYPEGISNVLLESSASGRPVITTNRSGCRETVDIGVNGFIVNQQDEQDLILKIEKFINLSYEEKKLMGLQGRKKMEAEFDREKVVSAYLKEIKMI